MRVRCIGKWHGLTLKNKEPDDGSAIINRLDYNSPDLVVDEDFSAAFQIEGNKFGGPMSIQCTKDEWNTFDVGQWYSLSLT